MADTFSNDLRLRLQESGSNAGTWGDLLNGTITNIASGFGQGSEAIPNASTHTITLADGTADEARSLYLKCTGGGQACTVTLGPNTISKVWIIDNATSYTLTFSQGSGANVAIAAGAVKVIATDGAGSGAAVVDTLDGLEGSLSSLAVTGAVTATGLTVNGVSKLKAGSTSTPADTAAFISNAAAKLVVNHSNEYGAYVGYANSSTDAVGIQSTTSGGTTGPLLLNPYGSNVIIGGSTAGDAAADNLNLVDSGNAGMTIQAGDTSYASIYFKDSASPNPGYIQYKQGDDFMRFATNGSERMRIDSSGNVGIGTSSPAQKLHIGGTGFSYLRTTSTSYGGTGFDIGQHTGGSIYLNNRDNTPIIFQTNNTERMRIGASGGLDITNGSVGISGDNYVYSYSGGSSGQVRSGIKLEGSTNTLEFYTGQNEAMRIDSGGNFIVGATSAFSSSSFCVDQSGLGQFRRDGTPLLVRRDGSIGDLISFEDDGASVGSIGITTSAGGTRFAIGAVGDPGIIFAGTGVFPATQITASDNVSDLGSGAYRWKNVYRAGSTYSTSDRNMKQDIRDLTDAERNVAVAAKGLLKAFRFIDRVEEEGNSANIHFGIIAQDLAVAFTAEGLDANDYQVYKAAVETDEDGNEQTRLNVCYENLLAFIIAAI